MNKDFFEWHRRKSDLDSNFYKAYFHEREIWWCSLGLNIGHEQDGRGEDFNRPVLIFKKFNEEMFWGVPLSTQPKIDRFHLPIFLEDGIKRVAILSQLRILDAKRLTDKISMITEGNYEDIKRAVIDLCR